MKKCALILVFVLFCSPVFAQSNGEIEYDGNRYNYWSSSIGAWIPFGLGDGGHGCSIEAEIYYDATSNAYRVCTKGIYKAFCINNTGRGYGSCDTPGMMEFTNDIYVICAESLGGGDLYYFAISETDC